MGKWNSPAVVTITKFIMQICKYIILIFIVLLNNNNILSFSGVAIINKMHMHDSSCLEDHVFTCICTVTGQKGHLHGST